MRIIRTGAITVGVLLGIGTAVNFGLLAQSQSNDNNVAIMDACDPADPAWLPTGGCTLRARQGDVTNAEFFALLFSPLGSPGLVIGHPAWRNEPSYVTTEPGKAIHVTNKGGRIHTFTEVANFGGGRIPPLNGGLTPALECNPLLTTDIAPGSKVNITGLAPGLHKFQCCIHPWMRAAVRVD